MMAVAEPESAHDTATPARRPPPKRTSFVVVEHGAKSPSGPQSDLERDLAREAQEERELNKEVLTFFFEQHDRSKLSQVDALLEANAGRLDEFFLEISSSYAGGFGGLSMAFLVVDEQKRLEDALAE